MKQINSKEKTFAGILQLRYNGIGCAGKYSERNEEGKSITIGDTGVNEVKGNPNEVEIGYVI